MKFFINQADKIASMRFFYSLLFVNNVHEINRLLNLNNEQIRFISSNYLDNIYLDRKDYEEYLRGLDRVTREQLMNGNWYASVKGQLFDESDFHIISYNEYMKIPIVRVIRYWDLAATEVLNDDKLKGSDPDFTAGVLLAKDLNGNIYIMDSYEFQFESRNLINEIINTAARDKSDVQYIELDGSTGKNFGLLIIDELTRRGYSIEWNLPGWKG